MVDRPDIRGFVAPGTLPIAVRLDRTWVLRNRLSERHRRAGRCGCGQSREQEDHKVCAACAAGDRVHKRGERLRSKKTGG
jgi:hypothetical protein